MFFVCFYSESMFLTTAVSGRFVSPFVTQSSRNSP